MTLLTDKQREEVVEAMARAVFLRRNGMATCWAWDEGGLDDEHPGAREQYLKDATAALTAALPAIERAVLEKLSDPVFVRLNILSGGIARPDDLVWLHDTDGPVAAKVREAKRALMKECLNETAAVAYQQDADHGAANTGGADEVLHRLRALAGEVG